MSKVFTRRSYVKLDDDSTILIQALHELTYKKPGPRPQSNEHISLRRILQWVLDRIPFLKPESQQPSISRVGHQDLENGDVALRDMNAKHDEPRSTALDISQRA